AAAQQPAPATTINDPRVGKKVLVTVAGAALRTPEAIVWKSYLGETFTVSLVNGEWLWVAEKGGWLWEKETLPFENAVSELSKRISAEPSAENYHLRGIAYMAHREYDKALADFNQSLTKKPGAAGVLNNRGQARYLKREYAAAIDDFNAATKADAKHFVAMNNRALCNIALGQYDAALRDLNAALVLNKEYPEALNNRGVVHGKRGDFKAAIADYSAAIKIDARYTDAYGNRAFALRKQGQVTQAIADLKTAMEKDPLSYQPVNDLAWIYATTNDASVRNPKEAVRLATQACQMSQYADWNAIHTMAVAGAAAGDFTSAKQWISTAVENAPESEKARLREHQSALFKGQTVSD
ncbi:MAG: tetratricopeptide repeat protein, partial [Planctomycetaceae bacterium]|nr:tetratricopeptide repeat protein [Planctomycetaceae bacterium]